MKRLNLNTVLLVLGAAALFAPDVAEMAALLAGTGVPWLGTVARVFGAAALLLSSLPRIIGRLRPLLAALGLATPPEQVEQSKPEPRQSDKGAVPVFAMLFLAVVFAVVAVAHRSACAQTPQLGTCIDAANRWCVQPATAVGWQLNLKTGDMKNAAVLVGYSIVHQAGFAVGAGLYGGVGLSADAPNSPQGHLLISLTNFGAVGIGAQRVSYASGTVAWQALVGLYGALSFGGSPSYVRAARGAVP